MLDDVRAQLPAEAWVAMDGVYRDGVRRLEELAQEAEALCASAKD